MFKLAGPLVPQDRHSGQVGSQHTITFFYVQNQGIFLKEAKENEVLNLVLLKQKSENFYVHPPIQGIHRLRKTEQTSQLTNYLSAAHSEVKTVKYL